MGRRVLIADGNADSAESLGLLLEFYGYQVLSVHSGPEALIQTSTFRPDVAIISLHLPHLNGTQVCRKLCECANGERPRLLIAYTNSEEERDRETCREAGFDHYLLKPADPKILMALLK